MDANGGRPATVAELVDRYLAYMKLYRDVDTHRGGKAVLRRFLDATGVGALPAVEALTLDLARSYVARRTEDKGRRSDRVAPATVNVDVRRLRAWGAWLAAEGLLPEHRFSRLEELRVPERGEPPFLTLDQIDGLLEQISRYWWPMILTAFMTGLRKGELYKLRWEDIDRDRNRLRVTALEKQTGRHSKTWCERWVTIRPDTFDVLPSRNGSEWVFPGRDGGPRSTNCNRVNDAIKKAAREAGIKGADLVTLHWTRHCYATHLLESGVDLQTVGKLLGHKCQSTTRIYEHISAGHLQEAVKRLPIGIEAIRQAAADAGESPPVEQAAPESRNGGSQKKTAGLLDNPIRESMVRETGEKQGGVMAAHTQRLREKVRKRGHGRSPLLGLRMLPEDLDELDRVAELVGQNRSSIGRSLILQFLQEMRDKPEKQIQERLLEALRATR